MAPTIMTLRGTNALHAIDANDLKWIDASRPGLRLAPVTEDRALGKFLGLLAFEALASTGIHQHQDIAFSYFLDGGLVDYQGSASIGDMGINLAGATHDAIAYRKTLTASRLEGPVLYEGPSAASGSALHAGARAGTIVNNAPEVMPDVNIAVAHLASVATSVPGVTRRLIYDYHMVGRPGRSVQLQLLPGSKTPHFILSAPLSIFVIGGALRMNDVAIGPGGFGIADAETELRLSSEFGALALFWSEGPAAWCDHKGSDLFGF